MPASFKFILLNRRQKHTDIFIKKLKSYDNFKYTNNLDDIENNDIIITTPDMLKTISEKYPDIAFRIINMDLYADSDSESENIHESFEIYDKAITIESLHYLNMPSRYDVYTQDDMDKILMNLSGCCLEFERMCQMIEEIKMIDCISVDRNTDKNILIDMAMNKYTVSTPVFAENAISSEEGAIRVMREWLALKNNSFKKAQKYKIRIQFVCGFVAEAVAEMNLRLYPSGIQLNEDDLVSNTAIKNGFEDDYLFTFEKIIYTNDFYNLNAMLQSEHVDYELKKIT